jgi:dihydroorotate dehydrogenase electron transfer subunit
MRVRSILHVKTENPTVKTFTFKDEYCVKAKPGQFIMLWIPKLDEIPLSIMNSEKGRVSVTVKDVGNATNALCKLSAGDVIGIRGPFGNGFTLNLNKVLLIGGGTGIAPLFFLAKKMINKVKELTFITGAKTKNELLFLDSLMDMCKKQSFLPTTDDGSCGLKCLVTEPIDKLLNENHYDLIYTCGPEKMIHKVFAIAEKHEIQVEASLERLMKCGIGLCGSCVIGKFRVCRDGPVFNSSQLRELKNEFSRSKLDTYGKVISI